MGSIQLLELLFVQPYSRYIVSDQSLEMTAASLHPKTTYPTKIETSYFCCLVLSPLSSSLNRISDNHVGTCLGLRCKNKFYFYLATFVIPVDFSGATVKKCVVFVLLFATCVASLSTTSIMYRKNVPKTMIPFRK